MLFGRGFWQFQIYTLKLHCVKAHGMNKISVPETSDGDFTFVDIFPIPEIDDDNDIIVQMVMK